MSLLSDLSSKVQQLEKKNDDLKFLNIQFQSLQEKKQSEESNTKIVLTDTEEWDQN